MSRCQVCSSRPLIVGQVVGGQFQEERAPAVGDQVTANGERGQNGDDYADQVQGEDDVLAAGREERRGEQRVNRQAGAAGHVGCHDGGEDPVRLVVQGAGRHHRRHVAPEAHDERDERLAGQAQASHEPVHDERDPSHVAAVLEK